MGIEMVQSEAGQDIWNEKKNSDDACVYFFGSVPKKIQITRCLLIVCVQDKYQSN